MSMLSTSSSFIDILSSMSMLSTSSSFIVSSSFISIVSNSSSFATVSPVTSRTCVSRPLSSSSAFVNFSVISLPPFAFKMSNFASGFIPFSHIVTSCNSKLSISLYSPYSSDFLSLFDIACPPILKERNVPFLIPLFISFAFSMSSLILITT